MEGFSGASGSSASRTGTSAGARTGDTRAGAARPGAGLGWIPLAVLVGDDRRPYRRSDIVATRPVIVTPLGIRLDLRRLDIFIEALFNLVFFLFVLVHLLLDSRYPLLHFLIPGLAVPAYAPEYQ